MLSGISVKHILKNEIRIHLDDLGHSDLDIVDMSGPSWSLHRNGVQVGTAEYDLNNIIIRC
jgi:hypothetical protein